MEPPGPVVDEHSLGSTEPEKRLASGSEGFCEARAGAIGSARNIPRAAKGFSQGGGNHTRLDD